MIIWQEDEGTIDSDGVIDLIGFPATVAAEMALVMTAVRLLVMYYPEKRARWGRYMKEKLLIRALRLALVVMEIAVWSAAYSRGVARWVGGWVVWVRGSAGEVFQLFCTMQSDRTPQSMVWRMESYDYDSKREISRIRSLDRLAPLILLYRGNNASK